MDAFEQLVAELFFAEGYWVETSFKVDLTKDEKVRIGRKSSPRWEIDVVAYKASTDELLAIECKSFLDSTGVQWPSCKMVAPASGTNCFASRYAGKWFLNGFGSKWLRAADAGKPLPFVWQWWQPRLSEVTRAAF